MAILLFFQKMWHSDTVIQWVSECLSKSFMYIDVVPGGKHSGFGAKLGQNRILQKIFFGSIIGMGTIVGPP